MVEENGRKKEKEKRRNTEVKMVEGKRRGKNEKEKIWKKGEKGEGKRKEKGKHGRKKDRKKEEKRRKRGRKKGRGKKG